MAVIDTFQGWSRNFHCSYLKIVAWNVNYGCSRFGVASVDRSAEWEQSYYHRRAEMPNYLRAVSSAHHSDITNTYPSLINQCLQCVEFDGQQTCTFGTPAKTELLNMKLFVSRSSSRWWETKTEVRLTIKNGRSIQVLIVMIHIGY